MAKLQSDILGKVLFFYELAPIVIVHSDNSPLRVRITTDDSGVILDDSYWSDFNGNIVIDIRDLVAQELSFILPEVGVDTRQSSLFKVFHLSLGDDEVKGDFTVNGFSSEAANRMTDVDVLRVPEDYIIPLSVFNISESFDVEYVLHDGAVIPDAALPASASGIGTTSRMIRIEDCPAFGQSRFQVRLSSPESEFRTPVFEVARGDFEQYLFVNRYGGFDNIPMSGALSFLPEMSFESGNYNGRNEKVDSESEYIYSQNSGYLSRKVMELASELLCSSQIYHLDKNDEWRRIVVLESDLRTSSREALHSFTFRYKYADDVRPMSLKGKTAGFYAVGVSDNTFVYALTTSPMVIEHGKNKTPCVTVVDSDNQEVEVLVKHNDENKVTISWNGTLSGYVYLN